VNLDGVIAGGRYEVGSFVTGCSVGKVGETVTGGLFGRLVGVVVGFGLGLTLISEVQLELPGQSHRF